MSIRKIVGIIALLAGVVVLVLALAANPIFGRSEGFGLYQVLGTIGGVLAIAGGFFLVLKR